MADWPISGATSDHVPSTPVAATNTAAATTPTAMASAARARTMLATILAATTRERTGTSAKVIIPVRWDHSEVTSRMPAIGSRTAAGFTPTSSTAANVWSAASPTTARTATTSTVRATVATCSQNPARVLTVLRSSTATSRPRPGAIAAGDLDRQTGAQKDCVERGKVVGLDDAAGRADQLGRAALCLDPPVADDDDPIGHGLDLGQQVRGQQHGAAAVGKAAQQPPHPAHALRVE